jgi:hypothetical protein
MHNMIKNGLGLNKTLEPGTPRVFPLLSITPLCGRVFVSSHQRLSIIEVVMPSDCMNHVFPPFRIDIVAKRTRHFRILPSKAGISKPRNILYSPPRSNRIQLRSWNLLAAHAIPVDATLSNTFASLLKKIMR